jgi:hypothetical protein
MTALKYIASAELSPELAALLSSFNPEFLFLPDGGYHSATMSSLNTILDWLRVCNTIRFIGSYQPRFRKFVPHLKS